MQAKFEEAKSDYESFQKGMPEEKGSQKKKKKKEEVELKKFKSIYSQKMKEDYTNSRKLEQLNVKS